MNLAPLTKKLEAIGTLQPGNPISKHDKTEAQERLPPSHLPTIGDRMTEKGVTWAWYAGGWRDVAEGRLKPYGEGKPDFFKLTISRSPISPITRRARTAATTSRTPTNSTKRLTKAICRR